MNNNVKYFLGLDIGTTSVGWAVTDENYNVLHKKGKYLWGVRLFEEAESAENRRGFRGARRRLARKQMEYNWLCGIFEEEINKVDSNFLTRLKNSSLWIEDKDKKLNNTKFSIFDGTMNGQLYTDRSYYKDYPTAMHLRENLLNNQAKDIRLLFLALRNILKYRGHFYDNISVNNKEDEQQNSIVENFKIINQKLGNLFDEKAAQYEFKNITPEIENDILNSYKDKKFTKTKLKEELCEILDTKNNKVLKAITECLVNGILKLSEIKKAAGLEFDKPSQIEFDKEDYLNQLQELLNAGATTELVELVETVKDAYTKLKLIRLLGGEKYVCSALVKKYKTHKDQLKMFKNFIKTYYPSKYNEMFRDKHFSQKGMSNYVLYVYGGKDFFDNKKYILGLTKDGKKAEFDRSSEGFYKYVKSILNTPAEVETNDEYEQKKKEILDYIDADNFLPKPHSKDNSVYPNSLLIEEAKQILKTNEAKYTFLAEKDETGLTNSEKIIKILQFRVPYYVGPIKGGLNTSDNEISPNVWTKQQSSEKLTPWNFNSLVDCDQAEQEFITRMTNRCTYIYGKSVLPYQSILYAKFRVLNELNTLSVNGERLTTKEKQTIFEKLFKVKKKVTDKDIKKCLSENFPDKYTEDFWKEATISGFGNQTKGSKTREFMNDFSSYITIKNIIGDDIDSADGLKFAEDLIFYHTIMSDKQRVVNKIRNNLKDGMYPTLNFTEEQIKAFKQLNFSKWGQFSREFLEQIIDIRTGEVISIINLMWENQNNLQEIMSAYDIKEILNLMEENQVRENFKIGYDDVEALYCSPSVKRGVWQAVKIVQELEEIIGNAPSKIFVEVTRAEEANKKIKDKRQANMQEIYKTAIGQTKDGSIKETLLELKSDNTLFNNEKEIDFKRSDKLTLYYQQMGKCPYCGEKIEINNLYKTEYCDIDHIVPQSIVKDDSFNNRVLAHKVCNAKKTNTYPIDDEIRNARMPLWRGWKDLQLITNEKFEKLTRSKPFSEQELTQFVARDLVTTSQEVMSVINLLKKQYSDSVDVCFSKAELVSAFRKKYDIIKCRDINDLHHAKDAFLNIVVGNVFSEKWTNNPAVWGKKKREDIEDQNKECANAKTDKDRKRIQLNFRLKLFDKEVKNAQGKIVWNGQDDVNRIYEQCKKNTITVTHRANIVKNNGAFYDQTLYKATKHQKRVSDVKIESKADIRQKTIGPLNNTEKYGGYNSAKIAYYMVVESDDKPAKYNKSGELISAATRKTTIERVPYYVIKDYNNNQEKIFEYLMSENKLTNAKIIYDKLTAQSTVLINKEKYLITGTTGDRFILKNVSQIYYDVEQEDYIKNGIVKFNNLKLGGKNNFSAFYPSGTDDKNAEWLVLNETENNKIIFGEIDESDIQTKVYQKLSRHQNEELYKQLLKFTETPFYLECDAISKNLKGTMETGFDKFKELGLTEQAYVLLEVIKKFAGKPTIDLTFIGGDKGMCMIRLGKNITGKNIKLLKQSVTGLKYKTIVLSKKV